jgi:hypothetical protein
MTTTSATGKIKASRVNNLDAATYVGPEGQLWYDVNTGILRLGDNVTPGGTIVGGGGGNGTPSGPNASIQFNNGGAFGGNSALTFDAANSILNLSGEVSATGNITGNYFIGNGALLTGVNVSSNAIFNGNSTVSIAAADANVTVSVSGVGNVVVFTDTGITATGNVSASNTVSANVVTALNGLLLNSNVVTESFTIPPGFNAISGGPITVPGGVIVDTVDGRWTIV